MIIYGSRMYGVKNAVYTHGECQHCGRFGKQKSYDGRKWGHVYFIPLFPVGGHMRVLKECSNCNMGQHLPRHKATMLYRNIENLIQPCINAAGQGAHQFDAPDANPGEEPIDTGPFLFEAMEMLYVTGHQGDIPGILQMLEADGSVYEHAAASSAYQLLQGNMEHAISWMQQAADALPDNPYPAVQLSVLAARSGQPELQLQYLQQANDMVGGEDVGLMLEMTGPLEAMKRFDELTDLLDRCISLVPELRQDKKFMKLHKKYSKKAAKMSR